MRVRTERGAANLRYTVAVELERESQDGEAWVVCAEMANGRHVPVAVRAEYDEARKLCDELVGRLTGSSEVGSAPAGLGL